MLCHGFFLPKLGGYKAFLSYATCGWPRLTPTWPVTPAMRYALIKGFSTKYGGLRAFLSNLTPGWPHMTLHDLWPLECITLWSGVLPTKFGDHRVFISNFTSRWPLVGLLRKVDHKSWGPFLPPYQVSAWCVEALRNAYTQTEGHTTNWLTKLLELVVVVDFFFIYEYRLHIIFACGESMWVLSEFQNRTYF